MQVLFLGLYDARMDTGTFMLTPHGSFGFGSPIIHALPAFLSEHGYSETTELKYAPFHKGFNTELPVFEWMTQHPEMVAQMTQYMAATNSEKPSPFDVYPFPSECEHLGEDRVLFVDVGGNVGHQCVSLREKCPQLKGRVVLQDLKAVVQHAKVLSSIEVMEHDFFDPQPVQGV